MLWILGKRVNWCFSFNEEVCVMKVNELKSAIGNYDNNLKDKIIIELYKKIPLKIKEEYDIDSFILNRDKKVIKIEESLSIDQLEQTLKYFFECVKKDLYISPNRIIPKGERTKWRFKIKKYYNDLNSFSPNTEEGKIATKLLAELFMILSKGTHILLFPSWNTFGAIKVSQDMFYETIVKRMMSCGYTRENIKYCVELLDVELDPNDYCDSIFESFYDCLKTVDTKYIAIQLLNEKVLVFFDNLKKLKSEKESTFYVEDDINRFAKAIVRIYFSLSEIDNGIKYFKKNYQENNLEEKIYVLLDMLKDYDFTLDWITEYERYIDKIAYDDKLKQYYQSIKK